MDEENYPSVFDELNAEVEVTTMEDPSRVFMNVLDGERRRRPFADLYVCSSCAHSELRAEHGTLCPECGEDELENVMVAPTMGPCAGERFDFDTQSWKKTSA